MTRPRILVVDDDPGMLRATERVLGAHYDVASCRSAREALEIVAGSAPDVALLDIRMPDVSGFQLREALRECSPGVDVIFMTGSMNHLDATFVRAIRSQAFYFIQKPFDREVLLTLVDRCLELRRLSAENRRHTARLEAELESARRFQRSLLPASEAEIEGLAIAARYVPCTELGGDFYDYAAAGAGRATLLIADVAGHGVSAAMLTGIVKAAFDASRSEDYEPRAIVRRIAEGVRGLGPGRYVTALCARLDRGRGILEYVNAGHPPGIKWSARGMTTLPSTGLFVSSAFPEACWDQRVLDLASGDRILFLTDGLFERERADDPFGHERIIGEVVAAPAAGGPLLDALLQTVDRFADAPAGDDQALITATVL